VTAAGRLLREAAGDGEAFGALTGRPMVAVLVDGDPALAGLCALLRDVPCVTVGVAAPGWVEEAGGRAAPDLDILVTAVPSPPSPWVGSDDVTTTLRTLEQAVTASPAAAVALVQLLRFSVELAMADALVAESFVYAMLQAGRSHRQWLAGRPAPRTRSASPPTVVVDRRGNVLAVTLHRPEVRNAFNAQMRDELVAAFELAAADPTIEEVVVTGAGSSFCSGGDLDEFGTSEDPSLAHLVRSTRGAARAMLGCADRTAFFVHGACVGAGVELAALARQVTAEPGTSFVLPEVGMGLVPGAGGTVSVPRRIGRQRTAYLAVSGLPIDAATATAWGLVDELSEPPRAAPPP